MTGPPGAGGQAAADGAPVVLITGGATGIGRACAAACGAAGATVVQSVCERAVVGLGATVGPFAHLTAGARVDAVPAPAQPDA